MLFVFTNSGLQERVYGGHDNKPAVRCPCGVLFMGRISNHGTSTTQVKTSPCSSLHLQLWGAQLSPSSIRKTTARRCPHWLLWILSSKCSRRTRYTFFVDFLCCPGFLDVPSVLSITELEFVLIRLGPIYGSKLQVWLVWLEKFGTKCITVQTQRALIGMVLSRGSRL